MRSASFESLPIDTFNTPSLLGEYIIHDEDNITPLLLLPSYYQRSRSESARLIIILSLPARASAMLYALFFSPSLFMLI